MTLKHLVLIIILGVFFHVIQAQLPEIYFTIPSDSTEYSVSISPYRFAGYVRNAEKLTMNDNPMRIFETGAFAGRFYLKEGENEFVFQAHNEQGIVTRVVTVEYSPTRYEFPEDVIYISDRDMRPVNDLILTAGERLEVQCRATPGEEVQFRINGLTGYITMHELSEQKAGKKGIYQGSYIIQEDDLIQDAEIQFRIRKGLFRSLDAQAPGSITISDQFPRPAVITRDLADIRAGLGEARLGGARLLYGQEGQNVIVSGKIGNIYRLALTPSLSGWLHENSLELLSSKQQFPHNLIGSISIGKDSRSDFISLHLQNKVPFHLFQDGDVLYADIYYSTSNTTWVTDRLQTDIIKKVSWQQAEDSVYRLRIDLKDTLWGYYGEYDGNRLRIGVKKPPEITADRSQRLSNLTITIDPGHHGPRRDNGAIGSLGSKEKDVVLDISEFLQKQMTEAGAEVIMTREGDATVTWDERRETILNHEADIWISMHANSIGMGSNPLAISGTSTYYRHPYQHDISKAVLKRLLDLGLGNFGLISSFNFSPLQFTHCPILLVETAFMSHPEDEAKLIDPLWQEKIARAITDGVKDYLEDFIAE